MENTSDYFMPRPLLFCMKSEKSVCYSVPDNKEYGSLEMQRIYFSEIIKREAKTT